MSENDTPTLEAIHIMKSLNGWLGMICDEVLGTNCLEAGRAPTIDEARRAHERVRQASFVLRNPCKP